MATADTLQRFTFANTHVRGELASLNQSLTDLLARQSYAAPVNELLGELLAAAALLSATLKFEGLLTLQIQTNGPVRALLAETRHDGKLRGIARLDEEQPIDEPVTDTRTLLGDDGQLVITIDPDKGRRYQGIVPLEGGDVAKCLETYFQQSEQLGTRLWLACDGQRASGLLLQELPDDRQEDEDAWARLTHLADTLKDDELLLLSNNDLLHRLYHEEEVRLYDEEPLMFSCSCSKERLSVALEQLGYEECQSILDEEKKILADCQFCGQHYSFNQSDINGLFPLQSAKSQGNKLH